MWQLEVGDRTVNIIGSLPEALERFQREPSLAIDLETGGLYPWSDPLAVVTMSAANGDTAIIHCRGHLDPALVQFLGEPRTLIAHNSTGFDALFLATNGVDVFRPTWFDTLVGESVVLASGRRDVSRSLRDTLARRLGHGARKGTVEDHLGWMNQYLTRQQVEYCVRDTLYLHELKASQEAKARDTANVSEALALEMSIIPAVMRMSLNGLPISEPALRRHLDYQERVAAFALGELEALAGQMNWDSPLQARQVFSRFGAPVTSTAKEVLRDLAQFDGPVGRIATRLRQYREGRQVLKMYGYNWQLNHMIPHSDGTFRCHARFWQVGTETGRFSSSDPNLQQVPRPMRYVFQAPPGQLILSTDYSQIEVRLAAAAANDANLLRALEQEDIHRAIAATMFQKPEAEVTKEERSMGKTCAFTLLFGGGANTLYEHSRYFGSGMNLAQAHELVRKFFASYQQVGIMRDRAMGQARRGVPVAITMPHGLRRVLVGAELTGTRILNTTIQGAAASGLKYALALCLERGIAGYLSAVVHDEVVAVVPDSEEGLWVKDTLERCMLDGMQQFTTAPIKVESDYATAWGDEPKWEDIESYEFQAH